MTHLQLVTPEADTPVPASSPLTTTESDCDYGLEAQRVAEAHLAACWEAFYAFEEGDESAESPASAPFCGCETCVVRETLHAAWPLIERAAHAETTQTAAE